MNFGKCVPMCNHHYQYNQDIEHIRHPTKLPCATLQCISMFLEFHINGIIQCILVSFSIMFSVMLLWLVVVHFFLLLSSRKNT